MRVKLRVEKKKKRKEGREGFGCEMMMDSLQWNCSQRIGIRSIYLEYIFFRLFICMYHNFRWML